MIDLPITRARALAGGLALLLIALFATALSRQPDANLYTYRFALSLTQGHGLTFWSPDSQVTTYPVAPLLVALLKAVFGLDYANAGAVIVVLASVCGGLCLWAMGESWWCALGYAGLLTLSPVLMVNVAIAFALTGFWAAKQNRWILAGLLIGMGILAHPAVAILGGLLLFYAMQTGHARRFFVGGIVLPTVWLILVLRANQSIVLPSPGSLSGSNPLVILALFGIVALVWGLLKGRITSMLALLLAWGFLSTAAWSGSVVWLVPAVLILFWTVSPLFYASAVVITALVAVLLMPTDAPIPPVSSIPAGIVVASDSPATLLHDGPLIDLSGAMTTPPVLNRDFILRYAPDVIQSDDSVTWDGFKTTYTSGDQTGQAIVHQRVVNFSALDAHGVDVQLGRGDLALTNVAIGNTLHPGDLVRVRLDWSVVHVPLDVIEIKLDLVDAGYQGIVQSRDREPIAAWQIGPTETYHLLALPTTVKPGRVSLLVSVYYRAGTFLEGLKVAEVDVAQ
jgi:hypothetical protein